MFFRRLTVHSLSSASLRVSVPKIRASYLLCDRGADGGGEPVGSVKDIGHHPGVQQVAVAYQVIGIDVGFAVSVGGNSAKKNVCKLRTFLQAKNKNGR